MQSRFVAGLFCFSSLLGCATALAQGVRSQAYDLCARGIGTAGDSPFTKTLRVKLSISGPALEWELLKPFASQLIQATVWPNRAGKVFVQQYDPVECAASGDSEAEIRLSITDAELQELRAQLHRGDSVLASAAGIARNAITTVFARITAEEQRQWMRVFYATNRTPLGSTE